MRKGVLKTLKFIAFLAAGLLLLWLAFRNTDFRKLWEDLKYADYSWILLSMLFGLFAYISRARRWVILINALGYKPSLSSSYHSVMMGYLANLALPRIGELTRCVALGKKEKIPVDQLFGTVIVERTIDLFSLMAIMLGVMFTSSSQIVEVLNESIINPAKNKLVSIGASLWVIWAILLVVFFGGILFLIRYRKNLRKFRVFAKLFEVLHGVLNGLKTITKLERKWEFLFHTVFIWLNYALMTWIVVFSLESTSGVSFGEGILLLVIGGLAMSAPVQSGYGIFHYAISRALVTIENVSLEDGLAYAILTHESQLLFMLAAGAISFFLIFSKKTRIHPLAPEADTASPVQEV